MRFNSQQIVLHCFGLRTQNPGLVECVRRLIPYLMSLTASLRLHGCPPHLLALACTLNLSYQRIPDVHTQMILLVDISFKTLQVAAI